MTNTLPSNFTAIYVRHLLIVILLSIAMEPKFGIHILPCPHISLKHWCCSESGKNCCSNAFKVDMGTPLFPSSNSSKTLPPTSTAANTKTAVTTSATSQATPSDDECRLGSKGIGISAGLGSGLGACLVASGVALWLQRRMYKRKLHEMKASEVNSFPVVVPQYGPAAATDPVEMPLNIKSTVYEVDDGRREH